jgi:hypothetical protein
MSRIQTTAAVFAVAALTGVGYVLFFEGKKQTPTAPVPVPYAPTLVEKPVVAASEPSSAAPGDSSPEDRSSEDNRHEGNTTEDHTPEQPSAASDTATIAADEGEAAAQRSPPVRVNLTWSELEDDFRKAHARSTNDFERGRLLEEMYRALRDPSFTGSTDFPSHCAELGKWRDEFPESPLPLVVLATAHIEWAWEARGTGPAISVTVEGWKLFHTRIDEARRLAQRALDLGGAGCRALPGANHHWHGRRYAQRRIAPRLRPGAKD